MGTRIKRYLTAFKISKAEIKFQINIQKINTVFILYLSLPHIKRKKDIVHKRIKIKSSYSDSMLDFNGYRKIVVRDIDKH